MISDLAREAAQQWTVMFNPRLVGAAELSEVYATAFS